MGEIMRKLPVFEIIKPKTEEELLLFRHKYHERFMFASGFTGLIPELKKRIYQPDYLISLSGISEYSFIDFEKDKDILKIGSNTTLKVIIDSQIIQDYFPSLAETSKTIAMPQIRNVATIGGNICLDTRCYYFNQSYDWRKSFDKCYKFGGAKCNAIEGSKRCFAVFAADLPIILISVGAKVKIMNELDEEIVIPLEDFYTGRGKKPNILKSGEFVKEIIVENISKKIAFYKKFRLRQAIDFPACSIALSIEKNNEGVFKNPKIVLGAVDSGPVVIDAKDLLEGKSFNDEKAILEVVELIEKKSKPVNNFASTPFYRKKMAGILFKKIVNILNEK